MKTSYLKDGDSMVLDLSEDGGNFAFSFKGERITFCAPELYCLTSLAYQALRSKADVTVRRNLAAKAYRARIKQAKPN